MDHDDDRLPPALRALLADLQQPPAGDSRMVRIARGERAYETVAAHLGDSDPLLVDIAEILWQEYVGLGHQESMEAQLQRIFDVLDRPDVVPTWKLGMAFKQLAGLRMEQGRWDEAAIQCRRAIAAFVQADRNDDVEIARARYMLGAIYVKLDDLTTARAALEHSLPGLRKHVDVARRQLIQALQLLGQVARDQDHPDDAYGFLVEAMGLLVRSGEVTEELFEVGVGVGLCLLELERYTEAETCLRVMLDAMDETPPTDATLLPRMLDLLGEAQVELGQFREALVTYERALRAGERAYGPDSINLAELYIYAGRAHDALMDSEATERALCQAIAIYERQPADAPPSKRYADALGELAERYLQDQRFDEADDLAVRLLGLLEPVIDPGAPAIGQLLGLRGRIRFARGAYDEALPLLEQAVEILQAIDADDEQCLELMNLATEIRLGQPPEGEPLTAALRKPESEAPEEASPAKLEPSEPEDQGAN